MLDRLLSAPAPLLLGFGLVLAGCGGGSSSDGSGSGSDDNDSSGEVRFASSGQTLTEEDKTLNVLVIMTSAVAQDVDVHFTTTGDAQSLVDFQVITASPVTIPNQATQAIIQVLIFDDTKGEIDEHFNLKIVAVDGAKMGSILTHRVDILDNDGSPYAEMEPNDTLVDANTVDVDFAKTESYQITGDVELAGSGDPQDYFRIVTGPEDLSIDFNLDPAAAFALGKLTLLDAVGNVIVTYVSPGPGLPLGGVYAASAGEVIYMLVETEGSITSYFLDVVGLEFPLTGEEDDGDMGPLQR